MSPAEMDCASLRDAQKPRLRNLRPASRHIRLAGSSAVGSEQSRGTTLAATFRSLVVEAADLSPSKVPNSDAASAVALTAGNPSACRVTATSASCESGGIHTLLPLPYIDDDHGVEPQL